MRFRPPTALLVLTLVMIIARSGVHAGRAFAEEPSGPGVNVDSPAGQLVLAEAAAPGLGPDRWPDLSVQALETAQASLERFLAKYPTSDQAAAAGYRLGLVLMHPMNRRGSLESARTAFLEVVRRFPDRDEAARALYAASTCRLLQGARAVSAAEDARLVTVYGGSSAGPDARIRLARSAAILRETTLAAPLVDPLIASDARGNTVPTGPDGMSVRERAVSVRALVDRSTHDQPGAGHLRALDRTFPGPAAPAEIVGLEVDSRGWLWKLEEGSDAVVPVTGSGHATPPNASGERTRGFALDAADRIYLWDDKGIVLPSGQRFTPEVPASETGRPGAVRRIGGLAISPRNDLIVIDAASDRVLRYGMDLVFREVVATFESRPTAVRAAEDGTIWVLLGGLKQIVTIAPTGDRGLLALGGPAVQIGSPAAFALDGLGRPHVLDSETRRIRILDTQGRLVASIGAGPDGGGAREAPDRLRAPTAFAIDPAGRVYVADRKRGRIVRFQ